MQGEAIGWLVGPPAGGEWGFTQTTNNGQKNKNGTDIVFCQIVEGGGAAPPLQQILFFVSFDLDCFSKPYGDKNS